MPFAIAGGKRLRRQAQHGIKARQQFPWPQRRAESSPAKRETRLQTSFPFLPVKRGVKLNLRVIWKLTFWGQIPGRPKTLGQAQCSQASGGRGRYLFPRCKRGWATA